MSRFEIFRSNQSSASQIKERALQICPAIREVAHRSVKKNLTNQADEFDYDMATYCGLGILLTFLHAHLGEKVAHPITMGVLDWSVRSGIQKEGVAVTYARLKVNFDESCVIEDLGKEILEDMAHLSPGHAPVYEELIRFIELKIKEIKTG